MSAAAAAALQQKIRIIVMTGGVASVVAVGTWLGAGLKNDQEIKQVSHNTAILLAKPNQTSNSSHRKSRSHKRLHRRRGLLSLKHIEELSLRRE